MAEQSLFKVAPSHIYVAAHWERFGWVMTIHTTTGMPGAEGSTREVYGPLSGSEMIDVLEGALGAVLT